jgi:hypothetical protein
VLVPALDPSQDLRPLEDVLRDVLAAWGRTPHLVADEATARATAPTDATWPVLVTAPDTAGEKPYEEFVGAGERATPTAFSALHGIVPAAVEAAALHAVLDQLAAWCAHPPVGLAKSDIVACLAAAVPELRHMESARSLDDRM